MKKINTVILLFMTLLFVSRAVHHSIRSQTLFDKSQAQLEAEQGSLLSVVGTVYNIFTGNPSAEQDEGFSNLEAFKFTLSGATTSDGRFKIPDEFSVITQLKCSSVATSETIMGMTSYQKSLSQACSIEGSVAVPEVFQASFQASVEYQEKQDSMQKEETVSILRKLECRAYLVGLSKNLDLTISPQLVKLFRMYHAADNWANFIRDFGSHFVNSANYGAVVIEETSMSKTDAEKLLSSGLDIDAGVKASGSLFGVSAGAGVSSKTQLTAQQQNTLSKIKTTSKSWVTGVALDVDRLDNFNAWVEKVQNGKLSPEPVKYTVVGLENLFDTKYIWPSDTTLQELKDMKNGFIKAMKEIARGFTAVPADPKLVVKDFAAIAKLNILGAAFGPDDVTNLVRNLVARQGGSKLDIGTDRAGYGDPWPGAIKTFVVVYQYGNGYPQVQYVKDGESLSIPSITVGQAGPDFRPSEGLNILGATYGYADVTSTVQNMVRNDHLTVDATNSNFFDSLPFSGKSLVIVYQRGNGAPGIRIAREWDRITL